MPTVTPANPKPDKPSRQGTMNRKDLLTRDLCLEMGFNPIREAIKRYLDKNTPQRSKDTMLSLVADRFSPKMRSLEVTGVSGPTVGTVINIIAADHSDRFNIKPHEPQPIITMTNPDEPDTWVDPLKDGVKVGSFTKPH